MRLTDPWFDAAFYTRVTPTGWSVRDGDRAFTYAESQGVGFWCPCGYGKRDPRTSEELYPLDLSLNKGRPHWVIVPFSNPPCGVALPSDHGPISRDGKTRPRWGVSGSGLHDLTLTPSIDVGEPSCWHGYIGLHVPGEVTTC